MDQSNALLKPNGGLVQREEFGATEVMQIRETAATAVAAREKAAVEARYVMALQRPRNIEKARQQLLKACDNPDFAESSWYKIPNKGEGFTIRFAEEALRCFGNIYPETMTVYENEQIRIIRVTVTDLESNLSYSSEIIIQKAIERQRVREGQTVLARRMNSSGKEVFLIEATDDEVLVKQNSLRSKALRTDGLRLIPSWLKEEAKQKIFAAMDGKTKQDPDAAKRKLIDGFAEVGVRVTDLEAYLGHGLEQVSVKELVDLKKIWVAVANGEISWAEVLEARQPSAEELKGSKEAQERVLAEKLAKAKQDNPQQQNSGGVQQGSTEPAKDGNSAESGTDVKSATPPPAGKGQNKKFFD